MNLYQKEIYRSQLEHGIKGFEWKNHKYIRKEGNRYIYPEDLIKGAGQRIGSAGSAIGQAGRNAGNAVSRFGQNAYRTAGNVVNRATAGPRQFAKDFKEGYDYGKQFAEQNHRMPTKEEINAANRARLQAATQKAANVQPATVKPVSKQTEARKSQEEANRKASQERASKEEQQIRNAHQGDTKRVKMQIYTDGDRDFDDKNYDDKNRLGNTDFFGYQRPDGKYVLLEEDMKWTLNKKPDADMVKRLEALDKYLDRSNEANVQWSADDWENWATQAINGRDFSKVEPKKNHTTKSFRDGTRKYRTIDQVTSAHRVATKNKGYDYLKLNTNKFATPELERQKRKTAERKAAKKSYSPLNRQPKRELKKIR